MFSTTTLLNRNRQFASEFAASDLPILPKLRTVVLTCGDSRVDPAHILGLELGDAVVIRNNGGRVTPAVIEEIAVLAFIVAQLDGAEPRSFELVIIQHTQCGVERFADPNVQGALKQQVGIDVSSAAISDHEQSLREDFDRLRNAPEAPGHIVVSGYIYDVENGRMREIIAPTSLESTRPESTSTPNGAQIGECSSVETPALRCDNNAVD